MGVLSVPWGPAVRLTTLDWGLPENMARSQMRPHPFSSPPPTYTPHTPHTAHTHAHSHTYTTHTHHTHHTCSLTPTHAPTHIYTHTCSHVHAQTPTHTYTPSHTHAHTETKSILIPSKMHIDFFSPLWFILLSLLSHPQLIYSTGPTGIQLALCIHGFYMHKFNQYLG
jgi:hypothetical protein